MKNWYWLLIASIIAMILIGCTERKDPVSLEYERAFRLLSQTHTLGWASDLWVSGDKAFVVDGEHGLTVWDISDLRNPVISDTFFTTGPPEMVAYGPQSNLVLVSEDVAAGGVRFYDYDMNGNPWMTSVFDAGVTEFGIYEITADSILIYEVDRSEGFKVFTPYFSAAAGIWITYDIAAGTIPFIEGSNRGLHFDYDRAYIARNQFGLSIVGIEYTSSAHTITELGYIDTPGAARDVTINEDKSLAIVADYSTGIVLVDITDPHTPEIASIFNPGGVDQVIKIVARGNIVYFLDENNGMFAVDVSDPKNPMLVGRFDTPDPTEILINENGTIFISDQDWGLVILEWR